MRRQRIGWLQRVCTYFVILSFMLSLCAPLGLAAERAAPASGEAQLPALDPAPEPTLSESAAPTAESVTPNAIDCAAPRLRKFSILYEDEVAVVMRDPDNARAYRIFDSNSTGDSLGSPIYSTHGSAKVNWVSACPVDFNGDGQFAVLTCYRDADDVVTCSVTQPGTLLSNPTWGAPLDVRNQGLNVRFIDVAAGYLSRGSREQAVVVYRNQSGDLAMTVVQGLDGATDDSIFGTRTYGPTWPSPSFNYNGNVTHLAVATGDLNGDGYNDEIVTAFKNPSGQLEVLVTRVSGGSFSELDRQAFTDLDRENVVKSAFTDKGIDVTCGDADGDLRDEIMLAFVDKRGLVQIQVLEWQDGQLVDTMYRVQRNPYEDMRKWSYSFGWDIIRSISVAPADVDKDGRAEMIVGYSQDGNVPPVIAIYEFNPPGSFAPKSSWFSVDHSDYSNREIGEVIPRYLSLDAGDIDLDGLPEIVAVWRSENNSFLKDDMTTVLWEVNPTDGAITKKWHEQITDWLNDYPTVVMADLNGDMSKGNYAGICKEYKRTQLSAVHYLPPFRWGRNDAFTRASFGESTSSSVITATTASSVYGGSVNIDLSISYKVVEIGPQFTYGYQRSLGYSTEVSDEAAEGEGMTVYPGDDLVHPETGALGLAYYDNVTYRLYKYTESRSGKDIWARIPTFSSSGRMFASAWNDDGAEGGQTLYPDAWVPLGFKTNLAKGKTATQKCDYSGMVAARAVDGNTNGNANNGSVAITCYHYNPWWKVNLGETCYIDAVDVWNRTDYGPGRLTDWYIEVKNAAGTVTWTSPVQTGPAGPLTTIPVGQVGNQVAVILPSLTGAYLQLAEVQVWGNPGTTPSVRPLQPEDFPKDVRLVTNANADVQAAERQHMFEIQDRNGVWKQVRGSLQWDWRTGYKDSSIVPGRAEKAPLEAYVSSPATSWNLQRDEGFSTEWSDDVSQAFSFGFEAKVFGAGLSAQFNYGFSEGNSYSIGWTNLTFFEGEVAAQGYTTTVGLGYTWSPYLYVAKGISPNGIEQTYLACDYIVPYIGPRLASPEWSDAPLAEAPSSLTAVPAAPIIASPSHPDPNTWYESNALTFTWSQPAGDTATIEGYRWYLDDQPDTIPPEDGATVATTASFSKVKDGQIYFHLRAKGSDGQWGPTAHRQVRVDRTTPVTKIALDPALPTGNGGWYVTPVAATISVTETGSGVQAIEYSTDGTTWQGYTGRLTFAEDTKGITLWARATDNAGNTSTPVSVAFKIDQTPPSSKIHFGEHTLGVWQAGVITDTMGNYHLQLAGELHDETSGWAGMLIEVDGDDWTGATALGSWHPFPDMPDVETNWEFIATTAVGRGNHVFQGAAMDQAGNAEEPYQIAQVIWFPLAAPELGESSIEVSPAVVRLGEEATVTLSLRNSGQQEAWVEATNMLPEGMTVITESLGSATDVAIAGQTMTWAPALLWPGEDRRVSFRVQIDANVGATALTQQLHARAFWPNTDSLSPTQRAAFEQYEDSVVATATMLVRPGLPSSEDTTAPTVSLSVPAGEMLLSPTVELHIASDADAALMYLRDYVLDATTGDWTVAQSSGWLPYQETYSWTLSAQAGVHYLLAWVADAARNVSLLSDWSGDFTNLLGTSRTLAQEQRAQYRFTWRAGDLADLALESTFGDADLYVWAPVNTFWPNWLSDSADPLDGLLLEAPDEGLYLVEALAQIDSVCALTVGTQGEAASPSDTTSVEKQRPSHPLSITTPLTGGLLDEPTLPAISLPLLFKR